MRQELSLVTTREINLGFQDHPIQAELPQTHFIFLKGLFISERERARESM